ncbi:MBL fold metallo-hydrolase [Candidatus Woesearchaeota archaeon]|nr:MBL fold metallo-hydrolase [Candidatus Woesearchaeota archaeon]
MLSIRSIGGYSEVGKNMTVVRYGNEVVILDMGIHLENYIRLTEDDDTQRFDEELLIRNEAIPDIQQMEDLRPFVKAIVPSHGHLDHIGAIPYIAHRFDAPILATPFTAEVIKAIHKDHRIPIRNPIGVIPLNHAYKLSKNITIEMIETTHSTPHAAMVALHTPKGTILYTNDFKLDMTPTLGNKPNIKRLKELGKRKQVRALIVDALYSRENSKTPSEAVAKAKLIDVLERCKDTDGCIIVSTFSSHIARIKTIAEEATKIGRQVVVFGRSMSKYVNAAYHADIIDLELDIASFPKKVRKTLQRINQHKKQFLLIVTGHQGEPKAVLSRMVDRFYDFEFTKDDRIIFSCNIIPTETNNQMRAILESKIEKKGVPIYKDIHVSGHGGLKDIEELIDLTRPQLIIPSHGPPQITEPVLKIAKNAKVITDFKNIDL